MNKVVSIHQPNFFPWLGYFDKINRSDHFIFLDDVQFPKTGGVWTNRVKLLISGTDLWITAPIDRSFKGVLNINESYFIENDSWRKKLRKTLELNYKRHPFYEETMSAVNSLLDYNSKNVAEFNINAITFICKSLGFNTSKFRRSSDIMTIGKSNELLCELTMAVGGDTYLCGGGSSGYLEEDVFSKKNIQIVYQNFLSPQYIQCNNSGRFVSGLSILDALMNLGFNAVRDRLINEKKI